MMKLNIQTYKKFFLSSLITIIGMFIIGNHSFAQGFPVEIPGSKTIGCLQRQANNLLVSTSGKSSGKILTLKTELTKVNLSITKTRKSLTAFKKKKDSKSKSIAKKLAKTLANLQLLKKGIQDCSKKTIVQSLLVDCSNPSVAPGTICSDGNPCTINDRCRDGACKGSISTSSLTCSFDSCKKVVQQCKDGIFISCFSGAQSDEVCNKIDDNCNGLVDEVVECLTPTPIVTITPFITPTPTITPTATPTSTATPTPTPYPCDSSNTNTNPNRCPCQQNGNCAGDCGCIIKCSIANPCTSGTCITDPSQSNFGSCSGVCLPNSTFARGMCVGGLDNPKICAFAGNGFNLSAKGCACASNNDCEANCSGGICT